MEQLKSAPTADSTTNCKKGFLTSLVFPPILLITVVNFKTKNIRNIRSEVIVLFSIIYFVLFFCFGANNFLQNVTQQFPQVRKISNFPSNVCSTQPMAGA